jgi:hypothetical protein
VIYFMQSVDGGPIKIGCSTDVDRRRCQLEATYGTPLAVLGTMEGGPEDEARIHARFSHLRLGKTEQFRPAPDLLAFVGKPLLVGLNPDAVEAMPSKQKPLVVQIRGSLEWKAWVEDIARREGDTVAKLFERTVRKFAKDSGYPDPPMR